MSEVYDPIFAVALVVLALIQASFVWSDYRTGRVRFSPMHFIERARSPRAFALVLAGNVALIIMILLIGLYYAARVFA